MKARAPKQPPANVFDKPLEECVDKRARIPRGQRLSSGQHYFRIHSPALS
jgi:hypothetical protein